MTELWAAGGRSLRLLCVVGGVSVAGCRHHGAPFQPVLTLTIAPSDTTQTSPGSELDSARDVLQRRLSGALRGDVAVVVEAGALRVDLADGRDLETAKRLMNHRGAVAFFDSPVPLAIGARTPPEAKSLFASDDFAKARVAAGALQGWVLEATLTPEGAAKLEQYSAAHIDHALVIALDGAVLDAPIVRSVLSGGKVQIDVSSEESARDLATYLKTGPLPFTPVLTAERLASVQEPGAPQAPAFQLTLRERLHAIAHSVPYDAAAIVVAVVVIVLVFRSRRDPQSRRKRNQMLGAVAVLFLVQLLWLTL